MILLKRFEESPKAAKTGRLWAVGSSGIGFRRGSVVWGGNLPKNRKFEEKTAFNGVKESAYCKAGCL